MEFLRMGSSIPGSMWGCCAVDIIQSFKHDPDEKASIQLVSGDGGGPITRGGEMLFAGPTYRDIFWQRLRVGTFDNTDMPNHAFLAVLTENQINTNTGRKWMALLKQAGFEFIRSVSNSVYSGKTLSEPKGKGDNLNHIFGLFRNIGRGAPVDPFTPPKDWQSLEEVTPEAWKSLKTKTKLAREQYESQLVVWDRIGPAQFLTEAELIAAGVPVTLSGLRSENPQELKSDREARKTRNRAKADYVNPFGE